MAIFWSIIGANKIRNALLNTVRQYTKCVPTFPSFPYISSGVVWQLYKYRMIKYLDDKDLDDKISSFNDAGVLVVIKEAGLICLLSFALKGVLCSTINFIATLMVISSSSMLSWEALRVITYQVRKKEYTFEQKCEYDR